MSPFRNCNSPGSEGWKSNNALTRETVAAEVPGGTACDVAAWVWLAGAEADVLDSALGSGAALGFSLMERASAICNSSSSFWRSDSVISRFPGFDGGCKLGSENKRSVLAPWPASRFRGLTLRLQLHVGLLHDSEIRVVGEHLRPLLHALQNLWLDLLMGVLPRVLSVRSSRSQRAQLTLSFARRRRASVKLLDASSRCIFGPQF
jgi:hypothetical protein